MQEAAAKANSAGQRNNEVYYGNLNYHAWIKHHWPGTIKCVVVETNQYEWVNLVDGNLDNDKVKAIIIFNVRSKTVNNMSKITVQERARLGSFKLHVNSSQNPE